MKRFDRKNAIIVSLYPNIEKVETIHSEIKFF